MAKKVVNTQSIGNIGEYENYISPQTQGDVHAGLGEYQQAFQNDSQYDEGLLYGVDQDEHRAKAQGIVDKLGNGLAHGLTTAGTSFVGGTVGLGNGLLDMMSGKSFYDNATFKLMDEISQGVNEATPLYQDKSEREGDFVDSVLTNDDFWIDGLFNGLGFVAGGYGSGALFGKAVGAGLKAAKLGQTTKIAEIAAKYGIEDVKGFADKVTSFAQKVPNITAATTGRIYESTVEANQVYESLQKKIANKKITKDQAKQARNAVFASNMALGIFDYFQYTKFLDNFSNHRASLNKIVKGVTGEYSQEVASKGFKAGVREFVKDSGDVIASMASEGAEEGAQHIISKTGETGDFTADNFMDSVIQAMSDPQFYGAMLSGSLVGGVMGVPNEFGKASKQNKYTDDVVNLLNEHTDNKGNQILDAKAKLNSYYTIEKAKNDLQEKMSNPNISQEEIGVLHDQYRTLEHTQLTNFVQAAVESKTIDDKLEELELLAKENSDNLAEQAGVTEPKIKNGVPQNTATQLREKIQKIKDYRQTYENLQHTYPNIDVPTLGTMFKAQTEFDFAEKKLGIVNSKLSEANGKLARIQAEEIGGTLSSENAKEQSKLHLETIKNLQAEKEYYEDLQTQSVKKFNNPVVKPVVTKVKPVTKNTPEQNQRSKDILDEIKLAETQQNNGVTDTQEDTIVEEEKPTITQLEKSVNSLNEEKTSLQKSFLDLPRKEKKQARKRISEIDKKLGELSPWIETLKKAKEPLVKETVSPANLRQPAQTYEERLATVKEDTKTPLLSNHNKFKKVLPTLTDSELYDKLEESKSQEKDAQRALSQAKLDKLKGLQSLTQEDIDEIKEISYFADRRVREVENEILKRSLEKQGVVIVLNQNSDSFNENKYAIRQAEIEEAFKNNSVEDVSENGKVFTIRGKKYFNLYSDPLFDINRDSNDNVVSVSLTDENNKSVTFSNDRIKDEVAFAILSQEVLKKEEKVIVSSEKVQEIIEQEISEDILLNDLIEIQETIALLKEDLNNEFLELVKLGFNKVEIKEHLKKEEKGKQLEELKEIESIIKKKLKGKSTLTTPVVKKSVKTKIKKNETKRTTRKTSTKTSEGVVEQVSTGEEHVVTEVPGQQVDEKPIENPSVKEDTKRRRQEELNSIIPIETSFGGGQSFIKDDSITLNLEWKNKEQINFLNKVFGQPEWEQGKEYPTYRARWNFKNIPNAKNIILDIQGVKVTTDTYKYKVVLENIDKLINAKYDAEYIDKVKKGEFTKQQAKDALKEINRLTPELEKQIDDAELASLENLVSNEEIPTVGDNWSIILDSDNPFDKKVEMISKILSKTSKGFDKGIAKLFTHVLDILHKQDYQGALTLSNLKDMLPEENFTSSQNIMLQKVVELYNNLKGFQEVVTADKLSEEAIQRSQSTSDIQDLNDEINEKIFNKEQITSSFSSAYKAVETVGNSKNPKFSGGKVVFVDNKDYDKMHTNKVQIGEEWEIQLVNKPGEDLDSLELEFKYKNESGQYESRGFLHTIEYINSNNLPLSKEELEIEREKIREIRQHYLDGGENLKVTLNEVTHAKIEDNQKLFPIEGLDMFRNIFVNVNGQLQQGKTNFEGNIVDDYSVEGNGSIYLMAPQATHTLGNPTVYIPQQLFKASLSQKKDAPVNTALEEIRQGIIKEITEFFNNPKYSIPEKGFVKSWLYHVSGDKAVTLDSGIKLTRTESGPRLQTRDADVTNLDALESIIDSLKPNIDKKRLDKSDYQQQLFNAKLLTTKVATKVIEGGERLYAFQPTFKFSLNSVIPSVKTKEVIEKVSPDSQSSIEELGSMGINLFEDEGDYSIDVSPEEGLQVNPELSLEEDNAIIDAIGYKIVTEKLNKEGVKDFFIKAISLIETTLKGEGLTEKQINSATVKLEGFKSIVKDFDKYFDKTKELLKVRDFKFNKEGIVEAVVELEEEGNQQMIDDFASKEDRLASAPSEIRRLISYTPMYDANNKPVLNHLGMKMFAPVDFVFSQLIEILCGEDYQNTEESFKKMTFLMSEASSKQVQHIGEIISTTKDTQLKNQFYNVFSAERENPITSVFFQKKLEVKGSQDVFGRPLKETKTSMRDNRADSSTGMAIIKNEWKQSLEKNPQLSSEEGINREFVKEIISDIDSVISNDSLFKGYKSKYLSEEGLTLVSKALNKLGIDVTPTGVNQFLKNIGTNSTSNRNDKTTLSQNLKGYFLNKFLQVDNLKDIFDNESSTLEKLATATLITSNRSIGGTYRVAGTQYSSIVRSSPMNEKINWVKRNWEDLKNTTPFRFLSNNLRGLRYVVDRGFRFNKKNSDPKFIKDTNPIEFETQNAIRFMANRLLKTETMSDKSWNGYFLNSSPEITSPLAFNSSTQTYEQNKEILDNLYKYFELELLKINTYQERLKNTQNILVGVDSTENVKGAGEYFYYYEFLNAEILEEGTEEDKMLLQEMYEKQNGVYRLKKIENLSPEASEVIRRKIQQRFNKIYANTERTWKKYGIIQSNQEKLAKKISKDIDYIKVSADGKFGITENGKRVWYSTKEEAIKKIEARYAGQIEWSIPQMPDNYKENFLKGYTEDLKVRHTLMDYTYSYMTSLIETNFMFGDPAQQSKMKVSEKALTAKQVLNGVISTFDNVGKRNARLKAQGNRGVWKTPTYKVLIVSDMGIDPSFIEQYPEDAKEAYLDKKNEKMTDAQELTTVWEHLSDRLAHGDQEVSVRELMLGMMLYDRGHYDTMYNNPNSELHKYPNVQPSRDLTEAEKREINSKGLLQPRKPVQVVSRINNGLVEEFYIKTSSIPLLPSVIKGLPMEKVYRAMLKNGVQRIPFVSGVKIGAIGVKPLFNEDGEFNEESFNHAVTLNRSGFHNQLAVPYDENKGMIREASQLMKLLFVDLPDETMLESGKTVKQLKEAYIKAQNNLIKKGQTKLLGKLFDEGAVNVDDNGDYIVNNVEKLAKLLLEEGDDFSDNTKKMLQTNGKGDFLFPLTFNPSIGSIQPILQALITNAMMRIKINGKSYVQASEVVTYDKRRVKSGEELTTQESNDIIYTKPEYRGLKKLKYIKKGENGAKSDRAQVYVPFYFTYDGKRVPVSKFIIENEDGSKTLDLERIPEELLVLNGFRIPTEGRKSMMMFDVVGFLPESMGDTVIVPSEIAAQMGSDYDVDKLYMYHYEVDYYNDMSEEDYDTEEQIRKIQSENYNSISDPEVRKTLESIKNEIEELKDLKKNAQTKEAKRAIQDQLDSIYEDKKAIHNQIGELKSALEQGSQMISEFKEKRKMRLDKTIGSDVNDLIDIHDQILMSSHAFDSVVTPQGFDALEASINEYYSKYGDTSEWTGMYDPNYQRNLFFDNKAGKQGTAIANNANTFHAIAQDAKLYINDTGILFKDEKGEYYNEANNVVKGKRNSVSEFNENSYDQDINSNSAWRLDKIFTYDGQPISQLISEWLGASVDNAKAKLLAKGGINDHNLALSLTLIQAGFNHDWVISFINQPILKDLYEEIDKNSSMFDTRFSPDKLNASREELLEKYSSTSKTAMLEGYMLSEYKDMLGKSIEQLSEEDKTKQRNILETFLHYDKITQSIRSVQSNWIIDSKGLPKNYTETLELVRKQSKVAQDSSEGKGIGNVPNLRRSIIGEFAKVPRFSQVLYSKVLDFDKAAYNEIVSNISRNLGKFGEMFADDLNPIYNGIFSYIYTHPDVQSKIADGKPVNQYKKELWEGLPNKLSELKKKYPQNNLLNRISIGDNGALVMGDSFIKTESLEKAITLSWLDAMKATQPDQELKQFGLDLAAYTMYFNNSLFGVSNFMKYLPFEYFKAIDLGTLSHKLTDKLNEPDFLVEFEKQYFQHNPGLAKSITTSIVKEKDKLPEGVFTEFTKKGDYEDVHKIILDVSSVAASKLIAGLSDSNQITDYIKFVKNYNRDTQEFDLFELVPTEDNFLHYQRIDTLGEDKTSILEYQFGATNKKTIFKENTDAFNEVKVVEDKLRKVVSDSLYKYLRSDELGTDYQIAYKNLTEEDKQIIANVLGFPDTKFKLLTIEGVETNKQIVDKILSQTSTVNPASISKQPKSTDPFETPQIVTIENEVSEDKNIYSKLGNKTQSENVVIKPWNELKNAVKAIIPQGIVSTRIPNTNEHFGNPFSHDPAGKTQGLIKTETIKEAVEKYIDWVINGANFEKKNLFTVKPIQSVDKKATIKASIATQYIGFGEGIAGSSTESYRQQAGKFANTGNYSSDDIIFVSIGGKRGNEQVRKEQQDKTISEALKAIEDGAILITDNKSYVDSNSYNTGEKRLAQNLTTKGYNYTEKTVDGQVLGVWFKGELNPLRSEWVREQLKSGQLKGKPILYYKELGEPSHATALDYLINKHNWNQSKTIKSTIKPVSISKQPKSTDPLFKFKVDGELTNSTDELLNNVISSSNKANSALAKFLKEHVKGYKVEYGSLTMGPGFHRGNVVKFDLNQLENKQHLIESTILHELFHATTVDKLDDPEFQKTPEYQRLEIVYQEYLDSFKGVEERYLALFQEELEKAKRDGRKINTKNLPQIVVDNYDAYYAATNLKEFVTGVMTSENTQRKLGSTTKIGKIVNEILQIIKDALGITRGSLLDEAVDSIIEVVKYNKPERFSEFGTDYKFVVVDGNVISGQYKQGGKEWADMNMKNIQDKYRRLSEINKESIQKPISVLTSKISGESTIFNSRKDQLNFTVKQKEALQEIGNLIDNDKEAFYLLAGYAGTGKTTLVENLIKYARSQGREAVIMAPTTKAVNVLNSKLRDKETAYSAGTIHSLVYGEPDLDTGEWVINNEIKDKIVIVDESSMIPEELMSDFIQASKNRNNIVIFLGDGFQLEQIGKSSGLFESLRNSSTFKGKYGVTLSGTKQLTEVKRQGDDSEILKVATVMREEDKSYIPKQSIGDFKVEKNQAEFAKQFQESVAKNEDSVLIVATNNERIAFNKLARQAKFGSNRTVLENGEKLISLSNSNSFANSEMFEVVRFTDEPIKETITLTFGKGTSKETTSDYTMYIAYGFNVKGEDETILHFPDIDKPSVYHAQILEGLEKNPRLYDMFNDDRLIMRTRKGLKLNPLIVVSTYGYAITGHKSQGSQWKKVFVKQNYVAPTWNAARWFYTAVTRASDEVIVSPTSSNFQLTSEEIDSKFEKATEVLVPINEGENSLGMSVGDLMKEMTSEQRVKFRELRESGIFTTKC